MIEQIQEYAFLIGITIGVVLLYLWVEARHASRINLDLIQLNEHLNFDTPAFLKTAWPLLSQADLVGISWRLNWFGTVIEGEEGNLQGRCVFREIQVGEMHLVISLFCKPIRGERRYFSKTLIETFLLLLRIDMLVKSDATAATFDRLAKLNLFLQHDMKNMAQFIQLLADQIAAVPAGKEIQVLEHLRLATPLMQSRAQNIVNTLNMGHADASDVCSISIEEQISIHCRLYQLEYQLVGTGIVFVPFKLLDNALDNIFKNYSDLGRRDSETKPQLLIRLTQHAKQLEVTIEASNLDCPKHLERLFEPFWSSTPVGLGIGLYQAKQMLELCQGQLTAKKNDNGTLQFRILLPTPARVK